jgi:guanine deaminase
MKGLSNLVKKYNVPIQTHISENKAEIQWVKELFPKQKYYFDVYDECGLGENALLGHGIYLSNEELKNMKKKNASVCHCPLSNFVISSGALDIRRLIKEEVKVGLGTDCSGGYAPSILNSIRNAIISSHTRNFINRDEKQIEDEIKNILDEKSLLKHDDSNPLSYKEAFYLGTLGGADVVGLKDKIGNFEVNKELDALLIDVDVKNGPFDSFFDMFDEKEGELDWFEKSFQRFIFLGDDRNIVNVFVNGKCVKSE